MSTRVRLNDGIEIETQTLGTVRCDPRDPTGDWNVISHAHTDHLPSRVGHRPIACSPLTADLAEARRDISITPTVPAEIELLPSGHIDGSRAALIRDEDRRILYTGDVALRSRYGLEGFPPPAADVLIVEATYGDPAYTFPPVSAIEEGFGSWLAEQGDRPVVCFAYALGKAQRVLKLLDRLGRDRIVASAAIVDLTEMIADATGEPYRVEALDENQQVGRGDAVILPSRRSRPALVQTLIDEQDALTAGFSGWALDGGYRYRRNVGRGVPLSDHCDFTELLDLVDAVDPEMTYIHHGFADVLARELTRRGYAARSLRRHQTTLDTF